MISNFHNGMFAFVSAPIKGPGNVNISNVTHESAVVSWLSIPVAEQRGFLQHYLIWISGQGNTSKAKVCRFTDHPFAMKPLCHNCRSKFLLV